MIYLCTQGLSTVLDVASALETGVTSAFVVFSNMGWTKWRRPTNNNSLAGFLKDAVSRVYEEQLSSHQPPTTNTDKQEDKIARRQHQLQLAHEIKETNPTVEPHSFPISQERPMSNTWMESNDLHATDKVNPSTLSTVSELHAERRPLPEEAHIHPAFRGRPQTTSEQPPASPASSVSRSAPSNATSDPPDNTRGECSAPRTHLASHGPVREPHLPVKSADRMSLVRLVALGWNADKARKALKATSRIEPSAAGPEAAVERAVAWMTERQGAA